MSLLYERAIYTEIGFSGNISDIDKKIAEEQKLKKLNRFEKWLFNPIIKIEKKIHSECFRQAIIDVTGDNPETDWE